MNEITKVKMDLFSLPAFMLNAESLLEYARIELSLYKKTLNHRHLLNFINHFGNCIDWIRHHKSFWTKEFIETYSKKVKASRFIWLTSDLLWNSTKHGYLNRDIKDRIKIYSWEYFAFGGVGHIKIKIEPDSVETFGFPKNEYTLLEIGTLALEEISQLWEELNMFNKLRGNLNE